jgi:hypothetical protein
MFSPNIEEAALVTLALQTSRHRDKDYHDKDYHNNTLATHHHTTKTPTSMRSGDN